MVNLVFDEVFLEHKTFEGHPESPERLKKLIATLKNSEILDFINFLIPDYDYDLELLSLVHTKPYIDEFRTACKKNEYFMHKDNSICSYSFDVAVRNVFAHFFAADYIVSNEPKKIFVAGRPPGHHADTNKALGFCFFNNIALVAKYLQKIHGVGKILIFDFDVHHGNGTQNIFYEDDSVFYLSIHEHPTFLFPGTGRFFEKGKGAGSGFTRNIPLKPEADDNDFGKVFLEKVVPAFYEFKPEILLVSAGFDGHKDDIIGDLRYSTSLYRKIGYALKYLSDKFCEGHLLVTLEGGYEPDILSKCVLNFLDALSDDKMIDVYDLFITDEIFGIF
ncbi:histone deacetylase [Deferribacter autotrophicus]|uniref:Histone deacetylase n=1 Tax=Deferribacter autotrophicus TaxID=500465 RepID=A0A5A8F0W5_9BACT|nr:histone deacetylase [Deferribacter autotrophicus]KAA0256996.1 histone deacetylase [Deferribacter autotrophicus]